MKKISLSMTLSIKITIASIAAAASILVMLGLQRYGLFHVLAAAETDMQAAASYINMLTLIVGLVLSVIMGSLVYLVGRSIRQPLKELSRLMKVVCDEHDLTQRAEVKDKGELGDISTEFNLMLDQFESMLGQISTTSSELDSVVGELSSITSQTSQAMDSQQSESEQVATAMNEMAATVQEVARNTEQAASTAREADVTAKRSAELAVNAMCGMDNLVAEVERAAGVITKLEEDSQGISVVLDVIKGIAEQTNLLALNAAIEAARAGEQGRGFAVVADEVRALAGKTQQSTQEIESMIDKLQAGARDAVKVMNDAQVMGKEGSELSEAAAEALAEIAAAIQSINDMNTQIASASEEQSAVAEEISRNISNISHLANETAGGTAQTSEASGKLGAVSLQLSAMLSAYNVK